MMWKAFFFEMVKKKTKTFAMLWAALPLLLRAVLAQQPFPITLDCTPAQSPGALPHFWRSVGYTPAEYALRDDELENTALIGAVPRRGVTQLRVHYLLDLVEVLGWAPSQTSKSGYELSYNWGALDHAIDFMVASRLSPGFELMGSPMGFPTLPISFWQDYSGNGKLAPSQTMQLWRQLTADLLARSIARYGKAEVQSWHLETWNVRLAAAHNRTLLHTPEKKPRVPVTRPANNAP